MLEHQQRVADEKAALDKKAKALSAFIGTSNTFIKLDIDVTTSTTQRKK